MLLTLPEIRFIDENLRGNHLIQLAARPSGIEVDLVPFTLGRTSCFLLRPYSGDEILLVERGHKIPERFSRVLRATLIDSNTCIDPGNSRWLRHPSLSISRVTNFDYHAHLQEVLDSWLDCFSYIQENPVVGRKGLRSPQLGALHAVQAHWTVGTLPGIVVMPTGTGKTETMLSVLVSARCQKLLVIVPTDALRTQIATKFITLGVLKDQDCSVLKSDSLFPVVGILNHIPQVSDVDDLFGRANVIVTTSHIAGQCKPRVQERMAFHCTDLFIDEAHHVEAPTWRAFKEKFKSRRVLQFTATPFREDGKLLDGEIIYKYPLRRAQDEGYFKPIRFTPVVEFNPANSDRAIADRAMQQLRADAERKHVLMARVETIERAHEVFKLYERYDEFHPVQLHSGISSKKEREKNRSAVLRGESRIVVCVDMLGEGFDLPELKIAAFHDIRKTLAVTLQLAGRFTRSRPDLGHATFIANVADVNVQDELRKLYTQDPDWNQLLPELSDQIIGEQISLRDFLQGFTDFPDEIPLKTVRPATSAVVYNTHCQRWTPENFRKGIPGIESCARVHHAINLQRHTLIIVTARKLLLPWTNVETLFNWDWELYVVIWSPEQNLLFINASGNAGEYKALAQAVAGDNVTLVRGQDVFRAFAGVNRLRLQNIGLTEQLGRLVRYTGRMGSDVAPALTDVQRRHARRAVLYGTGYEDGRKATVGASRKGRIWSFRKEHVEGLSRWCKEIGEKLLDPTINPDEVLRGTLETEVLAVRPRLMPIGIDWPELMYKTLESAWMIVFNEDNEIPLSHVSIDLVDANSEGPLSFAILSESHRVDLRLELFERDGILDFRFLVLSRDGARIRQGTGGEATPLEEFLYENPPIIWFVDGSSLEGNEFTPLKTKYPPYDPGKIAAWDWEGVNLRKESQGPEKDKGSIQFRVISKLKEKGYDIIFDDDASGEAADIVTIRVLDEGLRSQNVSIEFYHCKYSKSTSGQRVKDLYEVCGQAQKSISWLNSAEKQTDIFTHLLRRDAKRLEDGGPSRFERGDKETLLTIREKSRSMLVKLSIFVVQPGLSKNNATRDQLELLSVTENHLMETYKVPFGVIASA